jgi:anti-sigma B factor antagonist
MPNLELTVRGASGHAVVTLRGELDLACTSAVTSQLAGAGDAYGPSIIVDLAGLEFIDCRGLGALIRAAQRVRENGGEMSLVAPPPEPRHLLEMTGLINVFPIYPDVGKALACGRMLALIFRGSLVSPVFSDVAPWR